MSNILSKVFNEIELLKKQNTKNKKLFVRVELITTRGDKLSGDGFSFKLITPDLCRYNDKDGNINVFCIDEIIDFKIFSE
jgi:hypothetical protein